MSSSEGGVVGDGGWEVVVVLLGWDEGGAVVRVVRVDGLRRL